MSDEILIIGLLILAALFGGEPDIADSIMVFMATAAECK